MPVSLLTCYIFHPEFVPNWYAAHCFCKFIHLLLLIIHEYVIGRYVAPEVLRKEEYDNKVDVFSFALILQEVYIIFAI